MSKLEVITASAGTGKTFRLAAELLDAIASGRARPDAVVATTFTNKAAAELQERARARLLEEGRVDDAHRLLASRIGTVNAVCGQLVSDHALALGLSPDLRILDEAVAARALDAALASVISPAEERELGGLGIRLEELDWHGSVHRIVAAARANGVGALDLAACADRSARSVADFLGPRIADGDALDRALADGLRAFLAAVETIDAPRKGTLDLAARARRATRALARGVALPWREWASLAGAKTCKDVGDSYDAVRAAAVAHDNHPRLHADLDRAVRLVFDLAARALTAYAAHKRAEGAIDFIDQEALALALLRSPDIRAELREQIDLVLVDEFQDTSPIQLAIFLELSRCADHTVWVGDQKQAIFGFRGTDPALMDDALSDLARDGDPDFVDGAVTDLLTLAETRSLTASYRSRPDLVRLSSDMFAPAFAAHGIPEERVRIEPAADDEPAGLGAIVEHWPLVGAANEAARAAALAAGVRDFLALAERVRDPVTGAARPVAPRDLAVLCRTNAQCTMVADALEALDLRARVPRDGLLDTFEARLIVAGLRLWVDPSGPADAAAIARALGSPTDGDAWLATALAAKGGVGFADSPGVRELRQARAVTPSLGVLATLDAVVAALDLRTRCRQWGDAPARLANLDALRGHAVAYVDGAAARREPATIPGLLAYLAELARESSFERKARQDHQAVRAGENAVTVTTWHRAKGLEWPVTVLFGLEKAYERNVLGVNAVSDGARVSVDDPLAGRWVRFWPTPYKGLQKGTPFAARVQASDAQRAIAARGERETLRLFYVGWTRARDRVVLAAQEGKLLGGILGSLHAVDPGLLNEPGPSTRWAGHELEVPIRPAAPAAPVPRSVAPGRIYPPRPAASHAPAFASPSALPLAGAAAAPTELGAACVLLGEPDMTALGDAVHVFLGADITRAGGEAAADLAREVLARWGVDTHLAARELAAAAERLWAWVHARWPGAELATEWPVAQRLATGTVVRGVIDLAVITPTEVFVIDHKAFAGEREALVARAAGYASQTYAYADALAAATDKAVGGCFIHLPLAGLVVAVERAA